MIFEGTLLNIHIALSAGQPMQELNEAVLIEGSGIEGDRYATGKGYYADKPDIREVTLIDQETLISLNRDHNIELLPSEHRRNLTTQNVPLNHLVGQRFKIGDTVLEGGRLNTPCKYLETIVGKKIFVRLLNRSGLNCRIIKGGVIKINDCIVPD